MKSIRECSILLVEDNDDHAELIRENLVEAGILDSHVHRARSLEGTTASLESETIDLVLLDLGLPDCRGLETLSRIQPRIQDIPLIVLTALDDTDLAVQAVGKGAQDYLVKSSLSPEQLHRSLRYSLERKRLRNELETRNQELHGFAHTIAHDLKNPIRSIQSLTEFIQEDNPDTLAPKSKEHLAMIFRSCERMQEIVDSLLRYARFGESGVAIQDTDIKGLVDAAVEDLSSEIRNSGAEVRIFVPTVEVPVCGPLIRAALQNLISNALKYRRPDEPPVVHIQAQEEGRDWVFSIHDNGRGIEPRHLPRIFDLFYRVGDNREEGTGIGLASCKKILDLHRGRIWADSIVGEGSTFFFAVPASRRPEFL